MQLQPNTRYEVFQEGCQNAPIGYLKDGIYYEREKPIGQLEGTVFLYFMKRGGEYAFPGAEAGRLEGDVIVRNDGTRFLLLEASE